MGIRLDWEVESEGGKEEVAEDAVALAAQRRRQLITQRALIVGAMLVIAGIAAALLRMQQVRAEMLEALSVTVEAETLALRLGNKDRYMALQGASPDWRSEQRRNFDIFQHSNPPMTVTDEILDLQMTGDEARVEVRVLIGEEESTAVWLYGYTSDSGWRHIGTEAEPWARQVLEGDGYRIEYEITDQAVAFKVEEFLRGWWLTATTMSGIEEPLAITIVLDDRKERVIWEDDAETRLVIPSREADGSEVNLLDPGRYRALAMRLADRWLRHVLDDRQFAPGDAWLEAETQLWMRQIFDPQAIAPPVLSQLTSAFGVDFVPHLLRTLREQPDLRVEAAMDSAMTASAPGAVVRGRLDRYMTRMLQAEFMLNQAWSHSQGHFFSDMFTQNTRLDMPLLFSQSQLYSGRLETESISVFDVEQFGDLMWGRVRFNFHDEVWPGSDTITKEMLIYVPFIERNGYWVHTWPTERDWGQPIYLEGSHTHLTVYELDYADRQQATSLHSVAFLLYQNVCNDFGVENVPYLEITISPNPMRAYSLPHSPDHEGPVMFIDVPSIHSYWGMAGEEFRFHENKMGEAIIREVFEYQSQCLNCFRLNNYIPRAIMEWEMDRYGIDYQGWQMPAITPPDASIPGTLQDIWEIDTINAGGNVEHVEHSAQYLGAKVLIEILMERYGAAVLPEMINNVATQYDADTWLYESVGVHAADLEAEWYARYQAVLLENGITQP